MTQAVLGSTTTFKILDTSVSPNAYNLVSEVLRIGPVGSTAPEVDVTNLDSTSKEYISGLADGATVEIEMNWIKGTQQAVIRDAVGTTKTVQITWPDSPNTTATFSWVILGFNIGETTPESQITASASGRISGDIAWG